MVESSDIYIGIDILLKDLYEFIESIIVKLPSTFQDEAKNLVQRTKTKIDTIKPKSEVYTSMQRNSVKVATDEYVETDFVEINNEDLNQANYDIPENQLASTLKLGEACPYDDLPSAELFKKAWKNGPLWRNERILFIEQFKKYYAIQIENWLLIYNHSPSEKHTKPYHSINITDYSLFAGKSTQIKQYDKRMRSFELTEVNGKKSYQFIARTPKEMEQWVATIKNAIGNKQIEITIPIPKKAYPQKPRSLPLPPPPPPPDEEDTDIYEDCKHDEHIDYDDEYQDIGKNMLDTDIYDDVGTAQEELTYDDIDNVKEEIAKKYQNHQPTYDYDEPNNTYESEITSTESRITNEHMKNEIPDKKSKILQLLGKNIPPPIIKPQILKIEQKCFKLNSSRDDFHNSSFSKKPMSTTKCLIQQMESIQFNKTNKYSLNNKQSNIDVNEYEHYDSVNVNEPTTQDEEKNKFSTFLYPT